ncbi:hypothetical protein BV898_19065, partial [Hypsibius exemplaris]
HAFIPLPVTVSVNAFLINTNTSLVLIDTGYGSSVGESKLVQNSGAPRDVTAGSPGRVLPQRDHSTESGGSGLLAQRDQRGQLQCDNEGQLPAAQHNLAPYFAVDRVKPFNTTEGELLPGFRAVTRMGHTPGHTQYYVESGGRTIVVWGDIMNFEWAQLPDSQADGGDGLQRAGGVFLLATFFTFTLAVFLQGCMSAAVPQMKSAGPGFFRLMLGDFEITALSDGSVEIDPQVLMPEASPVALRRARQHAFIPLPVTASVNAFLINTNTSLVLIDTGYGSLVGESKLVQTLRAAGYRPEDVDYVFLTHLHVDQWAGAEADYWLNATNVANSSVIMKDNFAAAQDILAPYFAVDRVKPFNTTEGELLPGFRAVTRMGHTPGHTQYYVESGGRTIVVWGDIMNFEWAQLPDPKLTVVMDYNGPEAAKARSELLEMVVEKRHLVAAAHAPFPGIGNLRRATPGFDWVPVRYDSEPTRNTTDDYVAVTGTTVSRGATTGATTVKSNGSPMGASLVISIFASLGVLKQQEHIEFATLLALVVASALLLPGCMPVVIPQVTTPGPGFFRLMLGDFEVTALHDGNGLFDPEELLANAARGQIRQSRQQSFVALPVTFSSTAFLVNTSNISS